MDPIDLMDIDIVWNVTSAMKISDWMRVEVPKGGGFREDSCGFL